MIGNLDDIVDMNNLPSDVIAEANIQTADAMEKFNKIQEVTRLYGEVDDFTGMTATERVLNDDVNLIKTCSYQAGNEGTYHPLLSQQIAQQQAMYQQQQGYVPYQQTTPMMGNIQEQPYVYPVNNPYMDKEYMEAMNYAETEYYNTMRGQYYGSMLPPQIAQCLGFIPADMNAMQMNIVFQQNVQYYAERSRVFMENVNRILETDRRTPRINKYKNQAWLNYLPCANEISLDPYEFDTEEEYQIAWEEARKARCLYHMRLFESTARFRDIVGTEKYEVEKEEMEEMYGYRPADKELEYRQAKCKALDEEIAKEIAEFNDDIPEVKPLYDANGTRKEKIYLKVGFTDENGNYTPMSKPVDPDKGYRTVVHTRTSDDLAEKRRKVFWTPYLMIFKWYEKYLQVMADRQERFDKYNQYTFEQLVGPEDRMSEYLYDISKEERKEMAHKLTKIMRGDRWQVKGGYASTFAHSGIDVNRINPSEGFCSDYNLARDIYAYDMCYGTNSSMDNRGLCESIKAGYDLKRQKFIEKIMRNGRTDMSVGATWKQPGTYDILPDVRSMDESMAKKYVLTSGYATPTSEYISI